jgi:hypothetical protein
MGHVDSWWWACSPVNLNDLGLKMARSKTFGFGGAKAAIQSAGYNDLMMMVRIHIPSVF